MAIQAIGMGMQAAGALFSPISQLFTAGKQKKLANAYFRERGVYQGSQDIKDNVTAASNAMQGRSAGAAYAEDNIQRNRANTLSSAARSTTSSAQLLAVGAGTQAQADDAALQLGQQEDIQDQQRLGQVIQTKTAKAQDDFNVFQDRAAAIAEKYSILGASLQNQQGAFSDIGKGLMFAGVEVADGTFNGLFKKNNTSQAGEYVGPTAAELARRRGS